MKILKIIIIVALICSICSCSERSKAEARNARAVKSVNKDILIGAVGDWNMNGEEGSLKKGIQLAVDMINSSGGVLGKKIKVIWKDDEANARKGMIVSKELCDNPDVVAIIGPINSAITVSVSTLCQGYGILMITPTATASELTNKTDTNLIFRCIPSDIYFAEMLMNYITNNGFKYTPFLESIVIYNENSLYGNGLAKEYENQADLYRVKIVTRRSYEPNNTRLFFMNDIKHIRSLYDFDAVLIAGQTEDAAKIISEFKIQEPEVQIFCSEGISITQLKKSIGEAAEDIIYCSTYNEDFSGKDESAKKDFLKRYGELPDIITVKKFKDGYLKRYGVLPDNFAAQGYDSVCVLINAMKAAGTTSPEKVAEALRNNSYKGVTGELSFKKDGDLKKKNVIFKKIIAQRTEGK